MSDLGRNRAIGNFIHRTETTTWAQHDQAVPKNVQATGIIEFIRKTGWKWRTGDATEL